jgi:hypothetical protein
MVSKPTAKGKKHRILGGIKVSSQQLSKWGKLGGRPQKWTSEAARKRAERLRKKQEKLGKKAELRKYNSKKIVISKGLKELFCLVCQKGIVGGKKGEQCQSCHRGVYG